MTRVFVLLSIFFISLPSYANSIKNADQRIDIKYAASLSKEEKKQTYNWLTNVSSALLTVYDAWPNDRFNVIIQRSSSRHSPVPWGQVERGTPNTVSLTINPEFSLQELSQDWTAYHEFSHLLIPYVVSSDLWISEGLATYYQNIIQARSGLLNETEFWKKLANGFSRGSKDNSWPQLSLTTISNDMHHYRSFMRVHWTGVHYWLTADIKLRQLSKNKMSLDTLLKKLKNCCEHKPMTAPEIVNKLDKLAGKVIFKPLFDEYRISRAMPNYETTLTNLGVIAGKHDEILMVNAINEIIRHNIYRGDREPLNSINFTPM
jgi:M61 glycyl aminopeptidase